MDIFYYNQKEFWIKHRNEVKALEEDYDKIAENFNIPDEIKETILILDTSLLHLILDAYNDLFSAPVFLEIVTLLHK